MGWKDRAENVENQSVWTESWTKCHAGNEPQVFAESYLRMRSADRGIPVRKPLQAGSPEPSKRTRGNGTQRSQGARESARPTSQSEKSQNTWGMSKYLHPACPGKGE